MAIVREYGIDVSYHQGTINWATVKAAGVNYVILRAGYGFNTVDTKFVANITGAIAAGIENIGIYWFSYAHDTADIETELASCLAAIQPYQSSINLPVWFDFEEASYSYVKNTYGISLTAAEIQAMATAWVNGCVAAGYESGIYSNKSNADGWFKVTGGQYLWQQLGCQFWYARYGANNEISLFITPAFEQTALSEHPETNIFQYSDVGRIDGINSQRVDLNVLYIDEPTPPTPPEPEPEQLTKRPSDNIDYVEARDAGGQLIGIIDTAKSIIWHSVYYGVGDFEIYVPATPDIIALLAIGNYITRPNDIEVGIVERIEITDNLQDGKMLIASGRFAKSILDRRHIYRLSGKTNTATILRGNVETAIRTVITANAINCTFDSKRNIPSLELGSTAGITKIIVDETGAASEKQVTFENLLTYTDEVLEEYGIGSIVLLDADRGKLQYTLYEGIDRSADNGNGLQPIIFSKDFDNLTESNYQYDTEKAKTAALIGGAGEGIERFYALLETSATGLARREMWVDAGSMSITYKDDSEQEQTYTDAQYRAMLKALGKQELAKLVAVETFSGTLDITNGNFTYNRDFSLGDIVTVQDNDIQKYINVRISEVTEVQDENGYTIEAKYISL